MIPATIEARYSTCLRSLRPIAERVRELVLSYCEDEGFAYSGRTKSLSSVAEKLESGRYSKWSDLDDLFGCTIVIPTLASEVSVLAYLRSAFREVDTKLRSRPMKAPDVFRFDATRFIGSLREPLDITEFEDLRFEVQVRTAFEHAWSVTTHALVYKNDFVDWRRLRLAAQLKASVEQLDLLVAGFETAMSGIAPQVWLEVDAKQKLSELFTKLFAQGRLPAEVRPRDLSRFADNLYAAFEIPRNADAPTVWSGRYDVLSKIAGELEMASVPRSISLFQFIISELAAHKAIKPRKGRALPITQEVVDLYPAMKAWNPAFSLAT